MIKRFFDKLSVFFLQFFKMATNEKSLFTQFYGQEVCGHQKSLLMITFVVHAWETINQLNGFSAQYVRFGSIATVSLIDNGQWN